MIISFRRKVSSVFLGFFYGGSVANGVDYGIEFVFHVEYGLSKLPLVGAFVGAISAALAAFLGAYSSQALAVGRFALASVLAPLFFVSYGGGQPDIFTALVAGAVGITLAVYGARLPLNLEDVEKGRLFGVRWPHWLWLWVPWQLVIANAVWLIVPPSLFGGTKVSAWTIVGNAIETPLTLVLLAYSVYRALDSIREDNPYSRLQSALMFAGWFFLAPMVINIIRTVTPP